MDLECSPQRCCPHGGAIGRCPAVKGEAIERDCTVPVPSASSPWLPGHIVSKFHCTVPPRCVGLLRNPEPQGQLTTDCSSQTCEKTASLSNELIASGLFYSDGKLTNTSSVTISRGHLLSYNTLDTGTSPQSTQPSRGTNHTNVELECKGLGMGSQKKHPEQLRGGMPWLSSKRVRPTCIRAGISRCP